MKITPKAARCLIHPVNCADMKQHPLVPEKPECRPVQAVLSSEMLAGAYSTALQFCEFMSGGASSLEWDVGRYLPQLGSMARNAQLQGGHKVIFSLLHPLLHPTDTYFSFNFHV